MRFSLPSQTSDQGVCQQHFLLDASGESGAVPGVLWTPAGAVGPRPLVLLGHGGGQSKAFPGVLARARRFVTDCGFAAAAIDAPGHGDRPKPAELERLIAPLRAAAAAGEPVGPFVVDLNAAMARRTVPEWQATLDALRKLDEVGLGPVGYWGVSMGAAIGIALAAVEPRITAGVFGLVGAPLIEAASHVTVPVEFLLQWDDEAVPRDEGLAVFDAFASAEKTLHANPGLHGEVPRFEVGSTVRFFARHLVGAA